MAVVLAGDEPIGRGRMASRAWSGWARSRGVDWTPGACRPRPDYGCCLARRWGPDEPVADAAFVLDTTRPARSLDLGVEPADADPQLIRRMERIGSPDPGQQGRVGQDLAGVGGEEVQEREFHRCQADRSAPNDDLVPVYRERQRADVEIGDTSRTGRGALSTEDGSHPRREQGDTERLDEIVVRAELEPAKLVGFIAQAGQHDDRGIGDPANPAQYLEAGQVGQLDIEDDHVRLLRRDDAHCLLARGRRHDRDTRPLERQRVAERVADQRVVVDYEDCRHLDGARPSVGPVGPSISGRGRRTSVSCSATSTRDDFRCMPLPSVLTPYWPWSRS